MSDVGHAILAFVSAIIGLAIVAVIFSKRANTAGVIGAAAGGLGYIINQAVSPVTQGATSSVGSSAASATGAVGTMLGGSFLSGLGGISWGSPSSNASGSGYISPPTYYGPGTDLGGAGGTYYGPGVLSGY
jgi:hypothetical protein